MSSRAVCASRYWRCVRGWTGRAVAGWSRCRGGDARAASLDRPGIVCWPGRLAGLQRACGAGDDAAPGVLACGKAGPAPRAFGPQAEVGLRVWAGQGVARTVSVAVRADRWLVAYGHGRIDDMHRAGLS